MASWGRGGAGNIGFGEQLKKKDVDKKTQVGVLSSSKTDLEAGRPSASSSPAPTTKPAATQDYAHMGRGGAGNWYEPMKLEKDGSFGEPEDSTIAPGSYSKPQVSTPWHPENVELPIARAGRGGAGNFIWKTEDKEKKRVVEEEKKVQALGERVERDVEDGLAKPGPAVLGGAKAGRGW